LLVADCGFGEITGYKISVLVCIVPLYSIVACKTEAELIKFTAFYPWVWNRYVKVIKIA